MITEQHPDFRSNEEQCSAELPKYQCYKKVWALKIKTIEPANRPTIADLQAILEEDEVPVTVNSDGSISAEGAEEMVGAIITPEDGGYASFPVSRAYIVKHNPIVGGYYVVYDDGYKSFSPAGAFESGYTRI